MRYIDTNVFVRFLTEERDKISEEFLNFFHNPKEGKIKVKLLDLKKVLERTLELWERHSDDIIDCYIVANMELENETELYSFDKKISKLGIKCVSPDSLSQ